jgi:DNA-binding winged helix-turn-helix (wHTH) protein/tetratricopeptide (TPR) repeat protein
MTAGEAVGLMKSGFSADFMPMEAALDGAKPIRLAHLRPFRLGAAEIRPPSREIVCDGRREVIEPRVMQVLVVLAAAQGVILSRDDLIDMCWEGRAVTDDAINRVISRLRAIGRTFGAFQVETIVKVGYRLTGEAGRDPPAISPLPGSAAAAADSRFSRRTLIAGTAAAAAVGTAVAWQRLWRHRIPAEAMDLYHRAQIAERQGIADQSRQTIAFYEQAVRIDPAFGDAWGSLALAYTHLLEGNEEPDPTNLPGQVRSAASRALALDPDNADARAALAMIKPSFRNWAERERQLRLLAARYPNHWLIHGRLAILLYEVGRLGEGIAIHHQALAIDPMLPVPYAYMVPALAALGRLDEAEAALKRALDVWPAHPAVWDTNFQFLLFSGRPEAAAAFLMEPESRPSGVGEKEIATRLRLAKAIQFRRADDVGATISSYVQTAVNDVTQTTLSASVFAALGRIDLAFESLDRYFFDRGSFGASSPIGPLSRRSTRVLFGQPFASARVDRRFADLLKRVGLETYWSETGSRPDYRSTAQTA